VTPPERYWTEKSGGAAIGNVDRSVARRDRTPGVTMIFADSC